MADIAKMSIKMGWNGKAAESGLGKMMKGLKALGENADKTASIFGRFKDAVKGANDVKGFLDMTRGVMSFFIGTPARMVASLVTLGGELETTQIKMGYLAGSFTEGKRTLEELRFTADKTGLPLESLVQGFTQLSAMGLSRGAASEFISSTATAAELLGGAAGGVDKLTGAVVGLLGSTTATKDQLAQLQMGGLQVFEAMAERMGRVVGRAVTVREAIDMMSRGMVLSGTAIQAIADAANSPAALQAAERFRNSFAGKLAELKSGSINLFADIGKSLIDSFKITELLAGLKGALIAVRDIVKEVASQFALMIDPLEKTKGIEGAFQKARDLTYTIAETLSNSVIDLVAGIKNGANFLEQIADQIAAIVKGGMSGWASGSTAAELERIRATRSGDRQFEEADATVRKRGIKKFFDDLRAGAAIADQQAGGPLGKVADEANRAKAALEATANNIRDFSRDTLKQFETPFEKFKAEFETIGAIVAQASAQGLNLTQAEIAKFQAAIGRRGMAAVRDLVTANETPDAYLSNAAIRGSAAASEAEIRARFGVGSLSVQERIENAIKAGVIQQEQTADNTRLMIDALRKIPGAPAVIAFPQ